MNLPVDRVQQIMKMAQQPISLQSPVGDGDDTSFGDFIEDKSAENPYDMTAYSLLREKIIDVLDTLTERERRVLSLRFGLVDGYSRTLEEVGKQFKVTRERIRQIEAKALAQDAPPDAHPPAARLLRRRADRQRAEPPEGRRVAAPAAALLGRPERACLRVKSRHSLRPMSPHIPRIARQSSASGGGELLIILVIILLLFGGSKLPSLAQGPRPVDEGIQEGREGRRARRPGQGRAEEDGSSHGTN